MFTVQCCVNYKQIYSNPNHQFLEQKFTKYNDKIYKCLLISYLISCSWLILDSQKRLTRKRCSQHTVAVLCTRLQKWSSANLILGRSATSGVLVSFYTLCSQQPCLLTTATLQSLPHAWRKENIQNHQKPQNVRYTKSSNKILKLIYFFKSKKQCKKEVETYQHLFLVFSSGQGPHFSNVGS